MSNANSVRVDIVTRSLLNEEPFDWYRIFIKGLNLGLSDEQIDIYWEDRYLAETKQHPPEYILRQFVKDHLLKNRLGGARKINNILLRYARANPNPFEHGEKRYLVAVANMSPNDIYDIMKDYGRVVAEKIMIIRDAAKSELNVAI